MSHGVQRSANLALLALLTLASAAHAAALTPEPTLPDPAELERQGAIIGQVFIYPGDIFDLEDPRENTSLYRLANRVHVRTQPHVIRQQLLFAPGDRYSQRLLDESARILRSARYLHDASVQPIAFKDGRVDVAVTTRDVWTLNPGLSFSRHGGRSTAGVELEELSLLGTGTDLSIARKSGVDRSSTLMEYRDRHVLDTWVHVQAGYASNSDGFLRSLEVERPFYSLDARWAAALSLLDDERIESLYDLGKVVDEFGVQRKLTSERRLFFVAVEAAVGRALDGDAQILLGGDNGLRGYPLRYQGGDARALLTVEQRYFTSWYPFRLFRVGGAAFVDIGHTWGESPASTPSQGLLRNVGIGLRFANSRSGLGNIIHVDLAFPLDGDSSIDSVQLLIETKERF